MQEQQHPWRRLPAREDMGEDHPAGSSTDHAAHLQLPPHSEVIIEVGSTAAHTVGAEAGVALPPEGHRPLVDRAHVTVL
jgi:hypothetical protein